MLEQVNSLKEKISNKLLMGVMSLDSFLGNGTEGTATSSSNYLIAAIGAGLGGFLYARGRKLVRNGHEEVGKALTYSSYAVFGVTIGYYIFR